MVNKFCLPRRTLLRNLFDGLTLGLLMNAFAAFDAFAAFHAFAA